jgi:hypothetical protein
MVAGFTGATWFITRRSRSPLADLGWALLAVAILSGAVYPWYFTWALVPLGCAASERAWRWLAAGSVALSFAILADGSGTFPNLGTLHLDQPLVAPLLCVALVFAWWIGRQFVTSEPDEQLAPELVGSTLVQR